MSRKLANYQISFPQGPLIINGIMSPEWSRFFLWLWNRTGAGVGIDGAYVAGQSDQNTSDITELTPEVYQNTIDTTVSVASLASARQELAALAEQLLITAIRAETAAARLENAFAAAEDVLKMQLLTSGGLMATAGHIQQEAALLALIH